MNEQHKRPGGPSAGRGRDFGGARREGGERRGGGRDRGGRGGKDRRPEGASASGAYRVLNELSALEKAMTIKDFAKQRAPVESIAKALRGMRLRSLDELDLNARGRLITTLSRVVRQPAPTPSEAPASEAAAEQSAPAAEPEAEATPTQEAAAAEPTAETPAADAEEAAAAESADAAPAEHAPSSEQEPAVAADASAPAEAAPAAPVADEKVQAYRDVMYWVGQSWRFVREEERAQTAFALSGRAPEELPDEPAAAPVTRSTGDRPARHGASTSRGSWRDHAKKLEQEGKAEEAARFYDRNRAWPDAMRLFEGLGDFKSALRAAGMAKDSEAVLRLARQVPAAEAKPFLEKVGAYEQLMEMFIEAKDYENVAKLYERARQFDQAALAFERAGKFSLARKAYERAKDLPAANRMRDLEVKALEERGDRLGAATVLMAAGQRQRAVESLSALPPPKAYRFLQKLKLDEEARALADRELAAAEASQKPGDKARWMELLGDFPAAAELWLQADRKDKASMALEQAGQLPRAAELAEAAGRYDKAAELFRKAGDAANADRVAALPPPPKPEAAAKTEEAPSSAEG